MDGEGQGSMPALDLGFLVPHGLKELRSPGLSLIS